MQLFINMTNSGKKKKPSARFTIHSMRPCQGNQIKIKTMEIKPFNFYHVIWCEIKNICILQSDCKTFPTRPSFIETTNQTISFCHRYIQLVCSSHIAFHLMSFTSILHPHHFISSPPFSHPSLISSLMRILISNWTSQFICHILGLLKSHTIHCNSGTNFFPPSNHFLIVTIYVFYDHENKRKKYLIN